jgi:DNA polymerase
MKQLLHFPEINEYRVGVFDPYVPGMHPVDATHLQAGTQISVDLGTSLVIASMDFETYSEAGYDINPTTGKVKGVGVSGKGGLPVVGTPNYASHPTTEILCLYYDLKDGRGRRAWYPGFPDPVDLLQHIASGSLIEAWNVTFEFWIWNMVCVRRYGWPVLLLEQCYCAMAKSRRHSLAGALGRTAKVLGTLEKDKDGARLIQKLTRPHTPTKNRPEHRWTPVTAWGDFLALYRYCDIDVQTEDHASAMIPDLSPQERATWKMDQTINVRGVPVDTVALDAMLDILGQTERKYNAELGQITGGAVNAASELPGLQKWLAETCGVNMPNMQAETITDALQRGDLPPLALRALEIRDTLGAANVKKLRTLKLQVSSDGRLRDQYMYCGADRTGRWSAGGVQLQNITSKGPKTSRCGECGGIFGRDTKHIGCPRCGQWVDIEEQTDWTVEAVEFALCDVVQAVRQSGFEGLATVEKIWGDPIALLCGCLRGLFKAVEGKDFICCDFSAIEAVAAACLARCRWRIEVFSGHGKIYEASASKATGIPLEEILQYKIDNGMHHPARKKIGKVRELAGGYGGWINAWKNFGADEFMDDEEIKTDVLKWRSESPEIEDMWGGQFRWCGPGKWDYRPELFGLEGAAINAILHPGQCFSHIDITYAVRDDILYCRLPSGRYLHYHRPRLSEAQDKLNRGPSFQITFEGYNSNSAKGPVGWYRMETYAGRLFENVVQAVALDIQAEALLRCEARGYPIVMHTHDEGTAEVPEGFGSVEEMAAIMSERPSWAEWWPLRAAGWRHKRYQKD